MTRAEHLSWAKERALQFVERGELLGAVCSMISDVIKYDPPMYSDLVFDVLINDGAPVAVANGAEAVRRWIEGFN
jgi:hypothetical protein